MELIDAVLDPFKSNPRGWFRFDIFFVWQADGPVKHWGKLAKIVSRICPALFKNKAQHIENQFVGLRGPTWFTEMLFEENEMLL